MRFCPVCSNYLFLKTIAETNELNLLCYHCGYQDKMAPKTTEEALILETNFQTAGGAKQKVSQLNEYTKLDPTLPHMKTIPCPNQSCPTQADPASRDILYIKTDAKDMKYQYACTACNTQWGS
jgi:DNA-directed RNA polymerase subunit M/transcription elongation factor TFIIS